MASAIEVANLLRLLAGAEAEPEPMTHLRLQKLLYYVQGWSLANRNKPMFPDSIEAWAHGPVVKSVWNEFKRFGSDVIPVGTTSGVVGLSKDEMEFISSVWAAYRGYSAISLREMTHAERPWIEARKGVSETARSSRLISRETMKTYFRSLRSSRNVKSSGRD